jgi:hypothetical protein
MYLTDLISGETFDRYHDSPPTAEFTLEQRKRLKSLVEAFVRCEHNCGPCMAGAPSSEVRAAVIRAEIKYFEGFAALLDYLVHKATTDKVQ